jgi:hypothetical protein
MKVEEMLKEATAVDGKEEYGKDRKHVGREKKKRNEKEDVSELKNEKMAKDMESSFKNKNRHKHYGGHHRNPSHPAVPTLNLNVEIAAKVKKPNPLVPTLNLNGGKTKDPNPLVPPAEGAFQVPKVLNENDNLQEPLSRHPSPVSQASNQGAPSRSQQCTPDPQTGIVPHSPSSTLFIPPFKPKKQESESPQVWLWLFVGAFVYSCIFLLFA